MTRTMKAVYKCPHCNEAAEVSIDVKDEDMAPDVRSKIRPAGSILAYRISSDDIKAFITEKAKTMIPDVKVEVVPVYCERRRRKDSDPHRSYASLRIAFSDNVLEHKDDAGWFGKIGETSDNLRFVSSLFQAIIKRYKFNAEAINGWLESYKVLEELEDAFGMTEKYINELKAYATPQRVMTTANEPWVIFAAAAEKVIEDMLSDPDTDKPIGRIQIQDVYMVSKDVVEFVVYVHPADMNLKENPHVRQILLGEEKAKR